MMTEEAATWLDDWIACDMIGDGGAIAAFIAALDGSGPMPGRRIGNAYAASIGSDGLLLETLMADGLDPVCIPAEAALAALRRAL